MIYVYRNGAVVEKGADEPRPQAVNVIGDAMPLLKHMGTGVVTDSKSHFRAMTKQSGAIEAGNDPAARREPPRPDFTADIAQDVKRAIQEVNSR